MKKNKRTRLNFKHGIVFASKVGDFVENSIGKTLSNPKHEVPVIGSRPRRKKWYRVPMPDCVAGDGSDYHIYISKGTTKNLCILLSGGGVVWNEFTAARPVTGAKVAAGEPNYYWNNLRPFTQIMNVNVGITNLSSPRNPFADWSFVNVTYATGDFHVGQNNFPYKAQDGSNQLLHFHGYDNFLSSMRVAKELFPAPEKILIAGNSAGAFAVPALAGIIKDEFYPEVSDITLFSDSALLLYKKWRHTAKTLWKADESIWKAIRTDNITADWYTALYEKYGNAFRYLYASSTRDYLLSTYYNDITKKDYKTDEAVQQAFFEQLVDMVGRLNTIADFHYYLYDWQLPGLTHGGTVHTAIKEPYFDTLKSDGVTMAQWLHDAVNGRVRNIGMELLEAE